MLTGSFFMLQVYDRVLPGRSVPTLVALMTLATMLYVFQGGLDLVRNRISVRVGRHLDETLGLRVFDALIRLPLKTRGDGDGLQPLRDLDQVRSFLASGGPAALFDLPWMPSLSWHLFSLSFLDRCHRAHRRVGAGCDHHPDRRPERGGRPKHLPVLQYHGVHWPPREGGMPRYCRPWVCAGRPGCAGERPIENISLLTRQPAMSPAVSAGRRRYSEQSCNRSFLPSAPISSSIRNRPAGIIIAGSILTARALGSRRIGDRELEGLCGRPAVRSAAGSVVEALAQGRGALGATSADRSRSRSIRSTSRHLAPRS